MSEPLNLLDLFSGIGGFSLGLERSGRFRTVGFCEPADLPRRILSLRFPGVPIYEDVRTLTAARLRADGIRVDALCGGFPCQDLSPTGTGLGLSGARSGLWFEYERLIRELRPRVVFVENSDALLRGALGTLLGALARLGYDAEWHRLPASAFGAPHERGRVYVVAYPNGLAPFGPSIPRPQLLPWPDEPGLLGGHDGFSAAMDKRGVPAVLAGVPEQPLRRHALGNALVPVIPEHLGRWCPNV